MELTSEILDRPPPSDIDAEMGVIGSILLDPSVRKDLGFLKPEDFFRPAHEVLFRTLMEMDAVDSTLFLATLRQSGWLDRIGGPATVAEIVHSVAVPSHAIHYAKIVADLSRKRAFVDLLCNALVALYSGRWTVSKLVERMEKRLKEI